MPNSTDSDKVKEWKEKCLDMIFQLIKEGRNCGIYVMLSLQRPDRENCPAPIKSQCNTKVIFHQNNIASSLVVCDSEEAIHLKQREAIVLMDEKKYMKTLYLDNNMIEEYIKPIHEDNHKFLNLEGYDKTAVTHENTTPDKPKSTSNTKTSPNNNKESNKAKSKIKTGGNKNDNTKG
jgi:S-DNA-T family DNA segregation ATPase FtsK/SpoIIIE